MSKPAKIVRRKRRPETGILTASEKREWKRRVRAINALEKHINALEKHIVKLAKPRRGERAHV